MTATMREATDEVDTFVETAMFLIGAATAYATSGVPDADTEAKIRRVRVVTAALQSALMNIMMAPPTFTPPTPGPTGGTAAPEPAAARSRS